MTSTEFPTVDLPTIEFNLPMRRLAYDHQNASQRVVDCPLSLNGGFIFAGGFKSKVITTSPLTITVHDDRFLKITNFTQEGGTERGVVRVNLSGDAGGIANVLSATRIDLSTGINSQNFPEIVNRAIIAGPAEVRIAPVIGATLVITYKKEPNGGAAEETPPPVVISPTPFGTATPSATPIPTLLPYSARLRSVAAVGFPPRLAA